MASRCGIVPGIPPSAHPGDDPPVRGEPISAPVLRRGTDQPDAVLQDDRTARRAKRPQGPPENDRTGEIPEAASENTESRRWRPRPGRDDQLLFLVAPAARGFVDDLPERDEELVEHFMDILKMGIVS